MKVLRTYLLGLSVIALLTFTVGCAISDYRGFLEHHTESEARLWGSEIAWITGDPALDGTYSYTVKYDFRGTGTTVPAGTYPSGIDINTYRNPVIGAFSRDGCVDRDGDEIQGRAGSLNVSCDPAIPGGTFAKQWLFIDNSAGCQFEANYKQTFGNSKTLPAVVLCFSAPNEEVDKDLDLQESFTSLDDMFSRIWSGAVGDGFTVDLQSISFNGGSAVALASPLSIRIASNDIRPRTIAVDLSTPAGKALINTLLANTRDEEEVRLSLNFNGGMRVALPTMMHVAFDHDALRSLLK